MLLVACACAPTLAFGFLEWDDPLHVTRNSLVVSTGQRARELFTTPALGYPIPITLASYRFEYALFGARASVFHFTNSVLHTANAALLFALGRTLGLSLSAALLGALFFGLHPAAAECASWITGRKDLLACCFGLCALLFAAKNGSAARLASVFSYGFGLLSKPSLAPLFLLVPSMSRRSEIPDRTRAATNGNQVRAELVRLLLPYVAVALPVLYLGVAGQAALGANLESYAPLSRARAAWFAFGHHAALTLFAEEPTAKYLYAQWPPAFPGKRFMSLSLSSPLARTTVSRLRILAPPPPNATSCARHRRTRAPYALKTSDLRAGVTRVQSPWTLFEWTRAGSRASQAS